MSKLTNKLDLPQSLVDAVKNDSYSKGDADISVTELQDPPLMRQLKKKHSEEIEEDVSDRIWSLLGQVVHGILERADNTSIAERRLHIMVEGWKLSGAMDRFVLKDSLLQDYKLTTLYKIKGGNIPEEWAKQLNIYAEILRQNGDVVKKLEVVAILRDWSKSAARREGQEYPPNQVMVVDIPLVDSKEVVSYIQERVKLHQEGDKGNYGECTKEERWAKDDVWAIMKTGNKRAVKLLFSEEMAKSALDVYGKGHYIEFREGENVRCASYCSVAKFCPSYQASLNKTKGDK